MVAVKKAGSVLGVIKSVENKMVSFLMSLNGWCRCAWNTIQFCSFHLKYTNHRFWAEKVREKTFGALQYKFARKTVYRILHVVDRGNIFLPFSLALLGLAKWNWLATTDSERISGYFHPVHYGIHYLVTSMACKEDQSNAWSQSLSTAIRANWSSHLLKRYVIPFEWAECREGMLAFCTDGGLPTSI